MPWLFRYIFRRGLFTAKCFSGNSVIQWCPGLRLLALDFPLFPILPSSNNRLFCCLFGFFVKFNHFNWMKSDLLILLRNKLVFQFVYYDYDKLFLLFFYSCNIYFTSLFSTNLTHSQIMQKPSWSLSMELALGENDETRICLNGY